MNAGFNAFKLSETDLESGDLRGLEGSARLLTAAIDQLQATPSVGARPDELRETLLGVVQKQYGFVQETLQSGHVESSPSSLSGPSPHSRAFRSIQSDFEEWVDAEGEKYGIVNAR
jgi:hypothetical protein